MSDDIFQVVWITKYALAQGIIEVQDKAVAQRDGAILIPGNFPRTFDAYYHPNEWFPDRAKAVRHAEAMRVKRIASLRKQIAKLEALRFDEAQP